MDHEVALSLPPTPSKSATAFTIEFDDLNNNLLKNSQKKNFERCNSLRDSLRRYAPEKLDKLTKPRTKDEDANSRNADTKSSLSYSNENHSDRNLSDGAAFLIRKMFTGQKVAKPPSSNNKSNKLANKTNHQLEARLSTSCKSSPLKLRKFSFGNDFSNAKTKTNGSFVKSPRTLEMDSGVCADEDENQFPRHVNVVDDDAALSETGTYTVELDNQDPIAEEARKRIDEIFGVKETKHRPDSLSSSSSDSTKPTSKHSFKISSIKKTYQDTSNRTIQHNSEHGSTTLKKAHDQQRNNQIERKNSNSSTERQSFRYRKLSLQQPPTNLKRQDSFGKSSVGRLSVSKSNGKPPLSPTNKKSQLNQNINLINQNNTFVFNCNGNNDSSNSLLNRARANSITRNLTKKTTRKDQLKDDDTGSIKSEDASTAGSTDLSSVNSEKCKSDTGQTSNLRFNRAFALRRARLGIDTPPLTNSSSKQKNTTNSNNKLKNSNKPNSHIPITSANQHQSRAMDFGFDRSDGGRYSLRASSSSKPPINNQIRLAIANKSKQQPNQLQQASSNNSLNRHETTSLISAISASKNKVVNKMMKKNSFVIEDVDHLKSNHIRANSFGNGPTNKPTNQLKPRLSSAASSSSNTMSNASTSEDLSNISDQMNVKNLQHLSPFQFGQLGRRIYSTKPHYMAQTNSFRSRLEENGNLYPNGSNGELTICDQPQSLSNELHASLSLTEPKKKFGQLSTSSTPQPPANFNFNNFNNSNGKSLSALDYLVLSAVHQLSFKLRCKLRSILDAEKSKYPIDNENRILIEGWPLLISDFLFVCVTTS